MTMAQTKAAPTGAAAPVAAPAAAIALSSAAVRVASASAGDRAAAGGASTPTHAGATAGGDAAAAPRSVEHVMDELMLLYLKNRGYEVTLPSATGPASASTGTVASPAAATPSASTPTANGVKDQDVEMNGGIKQEPGLRVSEEEKQRFLGIGGDDVAGARIEQPHDEPAISLEQYAKQLGLTTEACAANHILFYGLTGGDPSKFGDAYAQLTDWVCNSLDMYKYELHALTFPVFVHCFLDLIAKGYVEEGKAFFHRFAADHMRLHVEELRQLSLIFSPLHVQQNEYAQQVLHSKFNVHLSLLSFELLNAFLSQENLFLVLTIVNERVNMVITSNQPGMHIQLLEDSAAATDVIPNMSSREQSSAFQSSDEVAQVVATSDSPNESEIAAPLTSGEYNLEYMVRAAGGEGSTLADLHAIKVNWGVLPTRRLHRDHENDDANGVNGSKGEEDGTNGTSGTSGSSSTARSGDGAGAGDVENDKKSGTSASGADGGAGDGASSTSNSKPGDKGGGKAATDKTGGAVDPQRKAKRARLATDSDLDRRKSELEVLGPLPNRKNAFNSQILERLVLREPTEMKAQALEDLRLRATLNKNHLPSALCFSFVNSGAHINNMCFSEDVTMVGASCNDGSMRVWRNDDQPLGTARGSVYQGDLSETDEDEKTAILRGHSGAVYGSSFSPDNRFALTASADSTVRLWSLAAKSNVVIYRSHEGFPVWDVRFGRHGYYFASCSMDRTARLWSTDHMTPLRVFAGHLSDVDCVEFHPNQNYVATGSNDKTVRLWDVQTGKCVRIFTGHFHGVKCLAFSKNGRYLASSGEDQYINVWDLQAGKRLETLVGHKSMVTSLDFSQESSVLASSGMDSTVRLWDMQSMVNKSTYTIPNESHVSTTSSTLGTKLHAPQYADSSQFVRPIRMVRPSAVQDLTPSHFLVKTLRSKQTPIYRVQFTPRNLLLSGGVFQQ